MLPDSSLSHIFFTYFALRVFRLPFYFFKTISCYRKLVPYTLSSCQFKRNDYIHLKSHILTGLLVALLTHLFLCIHRLENSIVSFLCVNILLVPVCLFLLSVWYLAIVSFLDRLDVPFYPRHILLKILNITRISFLL